MRDASTAASTHSPAGAPLGTWMVPSILPLASARISDSILAAGVRLEQGATYVDLADPQRREFKGLGNTEVQPGQ